MHLPLYVQRQLRAHVAAAMCLFLVACSSSVNPSPSSKLPSLSLEDEKVMATRSPGTEKLLRQVTTSVDSARLFGLLDGPARQIAVGEQDAVTHSQPSPSARLGPVLFGGDKQQLVDPKATGSALPTVSSDTPPVPPPHETIDIAKRVEPTTTPEGSASGGYETKVDVADGKVTLHEKFDITATLVAGAGKMTTQNVEDVQVAMCPDSAGVSGGTWQTHTILEISLPLKTGTGTVSLIAYVDGTASLAGHVGDDAALSRFDLADINIRYSGRADYTLQSGRIDTSVNGDWTFGGSYLGVTPDDKWNWNGLDNPKLKGDLKVSSRLSTDDAKVYRLLLIDTAARIAKKAWVKAEERWRNDACVKIVADQGGKTALRLSETAQFTAKVIHLLEGGTLNVPVVAKVLTIGGGVVSPSETPVDSPASFTYAAPATKLPPGAQTYFVGLETTSKRGHATWGCSGIRQGRAGRLTAPTFLTTFPDGTARHAYPMSL